MNQLVGTWKNESEYDGTNVLTTIEIDGEGQMVTRIEYRMPESRQNIEHHGKVDVGNDWFEITLDSGFTQEFDATGTAKGPMRKFTESEFEETREMLSQRIKYQITPDHRLETQVQGPNGPMTVVYQPCDSSQVNMPS